MLVCNSHLLLGSLTAALCVLAAAMPCRAQTFVVPRFAPPVGAPPAGVTGLQTPRYSTTLPPLAPTGTPQLQTSLLGTHGSAPTVRNALPSQGEESRPSLQSERSALNRTAPACQPSPPAGGEAPAPDGGDGDSNKVAGDVWKWLRWVLLGAVLVWLSSRSNNRPTR